jgi:hypothetical protein
MPHLQIIDNLKDVFVQVFNFKLGCFVVMQVLHGVHTHPRLELQTWPGFVPLAKFPLVAGMSDIS